MRMRMNYLMYKVCTYRTRDVQEKQECRHPRLKNQSMVILPENPEMNHELFNLFVAS